MSSGEDDNEQADELANSGGESGDIRFIAEQIRLFPELLSKSQVPSVKTKKDIAVRKLLMKYEVTIGKRIDATKLLKKINNMKTRLKRKTDLNKTGNKRLKLLEWEKVMFQALQGDINPVVTRVPGKLF